MFFTYFKQIMSSGVDYNLTISQTQAGDLVVIVLPKVHDLKDAAQHQIGPLHLKGSAQELDQGFFSSITAPIRKTSGLLVNMAEYEKQQDAAAAESKAVKEQKEKLSKEGKEKKEKYDGFMKKAEEMEAAGNLDGALLQLQQARIHATDKAAKTIDQKIAEIKAKMGEGTLFGATPAIAPAESQSTPMPTPANSQPATASAQPEQSTPAPAMPQPVPFAAQPATPQPVIPAMQPAPEQPQTMAQPVQPNPAPPTPTQAQPMQFGMFAPPAPQSTPQPTPGMYPWPTPNAGACRDNEYEGYEDFPSEMHPPIYHGNMAAGAM